MVFGILSQWPGESPAAQFPNLGENLKISGLVVDIVHKKIG
jgi:hypothetical protein